MIDIVVIGLSSVAALSLAFWCGKLAARNADSKKKLKQTKKESKRRDEIHSDSPTSVDDAVDRMRG